MPRQKRIAIFKQELKEFEKLDDDVVAHMIYLYDSNLNARFEYSSMTYMVIGALFLWISWFFFNASSGLTVTKLTESNLP